MSDRACRNVRPRSSALRPLTGNPITVMINDGLPDIGYARGKCLSELPGGARGRRKGGTMLPSAHCRSARHSKDGDYVAKTRWLSSLCGCSVVIAGLALVVLAGDVTQASGASPSTGARGSQVIGAVPAGRPNPFFCAALKLGMYHASQGAQMYCFGPQPTVASARATPGVQIPTTAANVPASNLSEDVAPNGTRGYGQSEESVAANGPYVVEAWNDATSFFSPCGSPQYKEEATGFGFSADSGKTFIDLGGLPNNNCSFPSGYRYGGDPSVATVTIGGVV
jgi:hypothetical protein